MVSAGEIGHKYSRGMADGRLVQCLHSASTRNKQLAAGSRLSFDAREDTGNDGDAGASAAAEREGMAGGETHQFPRLARA